MIDISFDRQNSRWLSSVSSLLSMRVSAQEPTQSRTQLFKARGARVLGSGNFATVVQYPFMADKVIRISSTYVVNGEQDMYEDYVRYMRRSRSNNPCIPTCHAASTQGGFLFVLLDKYKPLTKPEQDKARSVFYGELPAITPAEKNLRAAYNLLKRSSLQADDVMGDNIMMHNLEYKLVDPLGGKNIAKPEIETTDTVVDLGDMLLRCRVMYNDLSFVMSGIKLHAHKLLYPAFRERVTPVWSLSCRNIEQISAVLGEYARSVCSQGLFSDAMALGYSFIWFEDLQQLVVYRGTAEYLQDQARNYTSVFSPVLYNRYEDID